MDPSNEVGGHTSANEFRFSEKECREENELTHDFDVLQIFDIRHLAFDKLKDDTA
jgi:hypothetical protein